MLGRLWASLPWFSKRKIRDFQGFFVEFSDIWSIKLIPLPRRYCIYASSSLIFCSPFRCRTFPDYSSQTQIWALHFSTFSFCSPKIFWPKMTQLAKIFGGHVGHPARIYTREDGYSAQNSWKWEKAPHFHYSFSVAKKRSKSKNVWGENVSNGQIWEQSSMQG